MDEDISDFRQTFVFFNNTLDLWGQMRHALHDGIRCE